MKLYFTGEFKKTFLFFSDRLFTVVVIKERPRFGAGHVCAGCPWNSKLHTGCVVSGNVRPARTSIRIGENTLQEKKKPVYMRAITAARSKLRIRKSGNPK